MLAQLDLLLTILLFLSSMGGRIQEVGGEIQEGEQRNAGAITGFAIAAAVSIVFVLAILSRGPSIIFGYIAYYTRLPDLLRNGACAMDSIARRTPLLGRLSLTLSTL